MNDNYDARAAEVLSATQQVVEAIIKYGGTLASPNSVPDMIAKVHAAFDKCMPAPKEKDGKEEE